MGNMTHWGAYSATVVDGRITQVRGHRDDPDPSPLLDNIPSSTHHESRVRKPAVRRGWLENGPGPAARSGSEEFVEIEWDEAYALIAGEIDRVRTDHGNRSIYGGSYGWASAGRFHHAQSQLHRFLNLAGGYTSSHNTYSTGTSEVIFPHLIGDTFELYRKHASWTQIAENTDLVVAFGGLPTKNVAVVPGGVTTHNARPGMAAVVAAGTAVVALSPVRPDLPGVGEAGSKVEWWPIVPATDTAVMLALAHTLVIENLVDERFVERYCDGYAEYRGYLMGEPSEPPAGSADPAGSTGVAGPTDFAASGDIARSAEWAAEITGFSANQIKDLARRMAAGRTFLTVGWALQRSQYGEQPMWAALNLACLLGQIGLPGGGFGHGYGSMGDVGAGRAIHPIPALPQGRNPIKDFIPVARISDMLLGPGTDFEYNGGTYTYPDIKLVYWVGGNPFHHHQDLAKLETAISNVDTVIVHEPFWTSTAKHADIVLPTTLSVEREDIGGSRQDSHLVAMRQLVDPPGTAQSDYETFTGIAAALGLADAFTEGKKARDWLADFYRSWSSLVRRGQDFDLPDFDTFWRQGDVRVPAEIADSAQDHVMFGDFRADPVLHRLPTPSGKFQLTSPTVAAFGYPDCPGHPAWLEPREWLGAPLAARFPLHLIADQPAGRLHSQLDMGTNSQAHKVGGREKIRIHPDNAQSRGISSGDLVRVFNDRGACLAGVEVSDQVRVNVVQLPTGAWFDPRSVDGARICVHGNPNVLTTDQGTSRLAQGCAGSHALVQVERFTSPAPPVQAFNPPAFGSRRVAKR